MNLSSLTKKLNSKLALTKEVVVSGIKFVVTVPSFEQQAILDALSSEVDKENPTEGAAEEFARRTLAYSLVSVDGEDLAGDTTTLVEEIRKWPPALVSSVTAAALNLRLEVAAKITDETVFEWFDVEKFSMHMAEKKAKELAAKDTASNAQAETAQITSQSTDTSSFTNPA